MDLITKINKLKAVVRKTHCAGESIGFVPTMGALHEGHLTLVKRARTVADRVVVSIFVNPLQFGKNEDFDKYPRNLSHDMELLMRGGVDYLFAPSAEEFYPKDFETAVVVRDLSDKLCGKFRPGHFKGVATVVAKLFALVEPDIAFFGQKAAQQALILKRLARDLRFQVRLQICPTVREDDGLAMSSRNVYLSPKQRRVAPLLYRSLGRVAEKVLEGERQAARARQAGLDLLATEPAIRLEYLEIVDTATLEPPELLRGHLLVAVAAHLGQTRLIDNLLVCVP